MVGGTRGGTRWDSGPQGLAALTLGLLSESSHGRPGAQGPGTGRVKYRTIGQIPQFTLNFVEFNLEKHRSGSTTEIEIIAPHKVVERTQNVTEKVTQVRAAGQGGGAVLGLVGPFSGLGLGVVEAVSLSSPLGCGLSPRPPVWPQSDSLVLKAEGRSVSAEPGNSATP